VDSKPCSRCGETKPLDSFYADPRHADGLQSHCKGCMKARTKARRDSNLEQARTADRIRHAANPERKRAAAKAWRQANRDGYCANQRNYKARRKNAPVVDLTTEQWLNICIEHDWKCHYCHITCGRSVTMDHVVPLSKGGSHTASNVVPACGHCNSRKNAKDYTIFISEVA
jgi:5-methylcytosine-specific restriction endonuclease McrA